MDEAAWERRLDSLAARPSSSWRARCRNLGQVDESVALLTEELEAGSDELDDAVRGFLALALTSAGREREAVSVALTALAPHLATYNRSLAAYAQELGADEGFQARRPGLESPS
ncbi:MAG TPA: tetratricopeptide repeat protein [Solirubrobacteraceae bacterium]|nr:tetratricopeptide repeat protein [Solirubrobacteraceae bacterium]